MVDGCIQAVYVPFNRLTVKRKNTNKCSPSQFGYKRYICSTDILNRTTVETGRTMADQGDYNVVVCVDSSDYSQAAFKNFCENLSRPSHTIHLLHVMEWWGDGVWNMSPARLEQCVQETNALANDLKTKYVQALAEYGLKGQFHKLEGKKAHVWNEIIEFSTSLNAKIIVVGCRGLNKLRKTLIGSNSDSILHHSHIPVLVHKH